MTTCTIFTLHYVQLVMVLTLMLKNMGPISASHSGSTAVTHCMYSLLV